MSSFVEAARQEKLLELARRGVAPFAYAYDRSHMAQAAHDAFRDEDSTVFRLAGRLIALRPHGKTTFAHLADQSGKIQLYLTKDQLGEVPYDLVALLDLGDFIGVEGPLFRTRTGEVTLRVHQIGRAHV